MLSPRRALLVAAALLAAIAAGCSSSPAPPQVFPTTVPSGSASGSPTPAPTPTLRAGGSPTPTPVATSATPTATPTGSGGAHITASLTSIVVCTQASQTCPDDLNPYAASGEEAVVLVKGVTGTLTASDSGGASVATISEDVFANFGNSLEYAVTYKTATSTPTSDTVTIHDDGTNSSVTIPVTILSPGDDAPPNFFALETTSGTACPGNEMTFGTSIQSNATIVLASSDQTLITIQQNGGSVFILHLLRAGSGFVTATAGSSTVIYPANIPATGFTSTC